MHLKVVCLSVLGPRLSRQRWGNVKWHWLQFCKRATYPNQPVCWQITKFTKRCSFPQSSSIDNKHNGGSGLGRRAGLFYCVLMAPPGVCISSYRMSRHYTDSSIYCKWDVFPSVENSSLFYLFSFALGRIALCCVYALSTLIYLIYFLISIIKKTIRYYPKLFCNLYKFVWKSVNSIKIDGNQIPQDHF